MSLQCKIDKSSMFHAIAKQIDTYPGGTDLKKDMGNFVRSKPNRFSVCTLQTFSYTKLPFAQ